ncbi:hypothetical protein M9458_021303, partial [Cirrhinus mrigala]
SAPQPTAHPTVEIKGNANRRFIYFADKLLCTAVVFQNPFNVICGVRRPFL